MSPLGSFGSMHGQSVSGGVVMELAGKVSDALRGFLSLWCSALEMSVGMAPCQGLTYTG